MNAKQFLQFTVVLILALSNVQPAYAAPPDNDNFADAKVISTLPYNDIVNNTEATMEVGEPQDCGDAQTVWYSFTPNINMVVRADMLGSSFSDTFLSVYQAEGPGFTFTFINCTQGAGTITFSLQAGLTYYIQVGSVQSGGGDLFLNLQEVPRVSNDDFANATIVDSLPFSDLVDSTYATVEPGEPQKNCGSSPQTAWYSFTPTADAVIQAGSVEGSFDEIVINIYQDNRTGLSGLSFLACTGASPITFMVQAGSTYYFQIGSKSIYIPGNLQLDLREVYPPVNDFFVNAKTIDALPFSDVMDNTGATIEYGEPYNCPYSNFSLAYSLWYSFTPAIDIWANVDMAGSSFGDTLINIYQDNGTGLGSLSIVNCHYYPGGSVTFNAQAGMTYYIQIGSSGGLGSLTVNLKEIQRPPNDDFIDATSINSLPFNGIIDNTYATFEAGEPQNCIYSRQTVWYSFTPTGNAVVRADMAGSNFGDTTFSIYQATSPSFDGLSLLINCVSWGGSVDFNVQAGATYFIQAGSIEGSGGTLQFNLQELPRPVNDDFGSAIMINALPYTDSRDTTYATSSPDDPTTCSNNGSVWYRYTPLNDSLIDADTIGSNYDTVLSVFTGLPGAFVQMTGGCNDDYYGLQSRVTFTATAGTTYYFMIGRCCGNGGNGGGSLQFNIREIVRPANDNFGNATLIGLLPFSDTVDITDATTESNEPQYCYSSPNTVWYSFTPNTSMWVQVDMFGSSFWGAVFNVYQATGPNITDLSGVQCAGFGNSAIFTVQAGTTYYIQAGSYYGSSGTLQLNLARLPGPANDDFESATQISSLPFDNTVDTQYSLRQSGEPTPSCASNSPGMRSVWYAFTPTTSGSVSASIQNSAFTPVFAAYTGSSLASLTQVGCQTYSGNLLTFHVNGGTTYYFQVGNLYYWEGGGSMRFHLDVAPQPVASFSYNPYDPSIFDTIQFYNYSYDPGQVGIQSFAWDFGDGTSTTASNPTHKYSADGDYTVKLTVTTYDGRTATNSQVAHVKTHDVGVTKISAPQSASSGQTRAITVYVTNKRYDEYVRVDLYKSVPGGFQWVGAYTQFIPIRSGNRTSIYTFNYTFTTSDVNIGKVTFKAVATIVDARDTYPSDNEAISSPPTKVSRAR